MYKIKFFYDRVIPYIFKYNRIKKNLYKMKFKSVGFYTILKYSPKYIEEDSCCEILTNRLKEISNEGCIEIQSFINTSIDIITIYNILHNSNKNTYLTPADMQYKESKYIEFCIGAWMAESSKYLDIIESKDIDYRVNHILEFITKNTDVINNLEFKDVEFDFDIIKNKGLKYIEGMLEIHMVKSLYKEIQESSDISYNKHLDVVYSRDVLVNNITQKYIDLGSEEVQNTSHSNIESVAEIKTNINSHIESLIEVSIREIKSSEISIEVNSSIHVDVEPNTEIQSNLYMSQEFIGLPDSYKKVSKFVESYVFETGKQNNSKHTETTALEYLKYLNKFIESGRYEASRLNLKSGVELTPNEIDKHYIKSAGGNIVIDVHKMISPPPLDYPNALDVLINNGKYVEELIEIKVNSPKSNDIVIDVKVNSPQSVDIVKEVKVNSPKSTDIIKEVYTNNESIVDIIKEVDTRNNTYVSIKDATDVYAPEYKAVKQGKLWRNVTGDMHDHIWLNSINEGFFFDELIKESKISFKAYLDFILFLEQLIYVSRFYYAASRAKDAIDDMNRILSEWMTESRPSEDPIEEVENLVRLYKWYADEYYYFYYDKTELNGITILTKIKDNMVDYFESRWGKRVVTYGADGMYIYSTDDSYIDRCRGHKHGNKNKLMTRESGKEIYGIEYIPTDIE